MDEPEKIIIIRITVPAYVFVSVSQIVFRDLQPTDESHSVDTVVTMKRYFLPGSHQVSCDDGDVVANTCFFFMLQRRLHSSFLCRAGHWKVRGRHHSSCIMTCFPKNKQRSQCDVISCFLLNKRIKPVSDSLFKLQPRLFSAAV